MKKIAALSTVLLCAFTLNDIKIVDPQVEAEYVRKLYDVTLTQSDCYEWLRGLCKNIGNRVSGSPRYLAAVEYTRQIMDSLHLDEVRLQPVMVPHWERGTMEKVRIINSPSLGDVDLTAATLGGSAATPTFGVSGNIVEVKSLDELDALGKKVAGKIVFFNRPMDPTQINTGNAYGNAVGQRALGPSSASKYGAVACLVRSMTLKNDDVPHSGGTKFEDGNQPIPAVALSVKSAELLSKLLKQEPDTKVNIRLDCKEYKEELAYNVIGEIRGSKYPNEIIAIGGHLDSWDIGEGAHDDGTGVVQSMAVLQIFKQLNYKPLHTIRVVLFANEENGLRGSTKYTEEAAKSKTEKQLAGIESDGGGHTPRGFNFDGENALLERNLKQLMEFKALLAPYGATDMDKGGAGADIGRLKDQGALVFGYKCDSQRYFDLHHSKNDVFENVHKRELELGAGAMATLAYLLDKYGVK